MVGTRVLPKLMTTAASSSLGVAQVRPTQPVINDVDRLPRLIPIYYPTCCVEYRGTKATRGCPKTGCFMWPISRNGIGMLNWISSEWNISDGSKDNVLTHLHQQ